MDVVGELTQQDPPSAANSDPGEENGRRERPEDIGTKDFADTAGAPAGHERGRGCSGIFVEDVVQRTSV